MDILGKVVLTGALVLSTAAVNAAQVDSITLSNTQGGSVSHTFNLSNGTGSLDVLGASAGFSGDSFFDTWTIAFTTSGFTGVETLDIGWGLSGDHDVTLGGTTQNLAFSSGDNLLSLTSNGSDSYVISLAGLSSSITTLDLGISVAEVTPVPLPGAMWLLGSALLGFAGVKRFRRNEEEAVA